MTSTPDTRKSLILRLADNADIEAWDQFVAIYQPLVFRLAKSNRLQDADCHEVVQEVLLSVSKAVERWDPDENLGRFRDWLFRIARNQTLKQLTRKKYQPIGTGDSRIADALGQHPQPNDGQLAEIELEYRREVFRWASNQVRAAVKPETWQAFWMTSIEEKSIQNVASELSMSNGAVHIARSRVRGRLRETVAQFESMDDRNLDDPNLGDEINP